MQDCIIYSNISYVLTLDQVKSLVHLPREHLSSIVHLSGIHDLSIVFAANCKPLIPKEVSTFRTHI